MGGVPRTDLAHVMSDGTVDPNWAPTTDGLVRALVVGTNTVFAGGEFSTANGVARKNLAGFNAATGALTSFTGGVSFINNSNPTAHPERSASGSTRFCSSGRRSMWAASSTTQAP